MTKILHYVFLAACVAVGSATYAQERTVSGRVTSAEEGSAIPGVNVVLKGTSNGTVTDAQGRYTLVASEGTLVFSFIGLKSTEAEIGGRSIIDVQMESDATQLSEVVVTALGIQRNKNELPYAAQQVTSDQIVQTRGANFVTSLSGRVAGLDIKTNNTMGGSTNVVIRGYKSIMGNNQALFVVDGIPVVNNSTNTASQNAGRGGPDYGNAAADINPDNIASVNVLKGAAATALYGSRAANGVIMITTKKGAKKSFDVTINSGITFGTINKDTYARYQKEYGGGADQVFATGTFDDGTLPAVNFRADASYGPRFDGSMVYHWDALDPFSPNYRKARPWVAAKNDPTAFFETSVSSNQSISVSGGTDRNTFQFGYTRSDEKGILPNSELDKNLFNFTSTFSLNEKLSVTASANFSNIEGLGRYGTGYNSRNPNEAFRQWWQMNVDLKEMKAAYFRNRKNVTWNWSGVNDASPLYSDNPYWIRYENYANDTRNHLFGYASANYKVTDWMDITGRVAYDGTTDFQEERYAVGSAGTSSGGSYTRFNRDFNETNFDLLLNFNKKISDQVSFRGLLGSNMRRSILTSVRSTTSNGLVVPKLYNLANSAGTLPAPTEEYTRIGVDGLFANATFGYKDIAFLELAGRREKSTTLPLDNNTFYYPSVGGTFAYATVLKQPWLSAGKVRVNYAEVGNDAPALSLYDVYDKPTAFGSTTFFTLPNTKNNANLKPERTKSYEAGIEADFFDGRVGFDFTAYQTNTYDQIIPVSITTASGFNSAWVNSGEMRNKGIEVSAFVTPVETNDFSWTMRVNFTRNRNKVIDLYGEGENAVPNVQLNTLSLQGSVTLNAAKGYPYGVIRGTNFRYTNGQRTVDNTGNYEKSANSAEIIGNPNPDWLGGIHNTLTYKGISVNFLIDIRHGGDIFSLDQWYGEGSGMYANTAGLNARGVQSRLPVAEGGGVLLPGVKADGSPNDIYAENQNTNSLTPFGYSANGGKAAPHAWYVYDGSYIKLREVALSYSVPQAIMDRLRPLKSINLSVFGRNLWMKKNMAYADPEEALSSGNLNGGYQSGAYPSVKTYGFNAKFSF